MPFKNGNIPWNKDLKLTSDHKKKLSDSRARADALFGGWNIEYV